jgi:hypothetical protein
LRLRLPILGRVTSPPDRYEPLPGFAELPRWLWRRTGSRVRIGVAIACVLAVAGTVVLVPAIDDARQQRAAAERREAELARARHERELLAEQRPRFGRISSRAAALDELSGAITADARRRVRAGALNGPIRRVECEPFPRGVDPSRSGGRYSCLAVTSQFEGGAIGHPYRAMIDFETGRYAFCKISGRPDPTPDPRVTTPRVCGG